jgi:hypothetical protein
MKRILLPLGGALLSLTLTPSARADFEVRAPFVTVRIGQPTVIRAPFVRIVLPGRPTRLALPPKRVEGPSCGVPLVGKSASREPTSKAMTVKEFAASFQPSRAGGSYEVVLRHTFTGKPVAVRFDLPPGKPKKVTAGKRRLVFRYGPRSSVVVRFSRDGSVHSLSR